jgi:Asp-tRNA(Asn)/Glu-tRNA(Gln) amidotransferase C subunit
LANRFVRSDDDISGRLAVVEHYVRGFADQSSEITDIAQEVNQIKATVDEILTRVSKLTDRGG